MWENIIEKIDIDRDQGHLYQGEEVDIQEAETDLKARTQVIALLLPSQTPLIKVKNQDERPIIIKIHNKHLNQLLNLN